MVPPPPANATGKLALEFEHVVGSQALAFGPSYSTLEGEQFAVSKFNYYVSNIKLTKADGTEWAEPESYHLVKHSEPASQRFQLSDVPTGDYRKLTFTIGVDSARNVAGAQTGALDPLNDMFWSWSSGYVFLKLEGTSPQATTGRITYHIGGFRAPHNTIRTVVPALPGGVTALPVCADKTGQVFLKADLQKVFTGPATIRIAQLSNTGHSSDPNSVKLANNYAAGMFRIDRVQSN
ncbi:hypothetical protein GCM10027048_19280 [Hymenobacter coalescens]